MALTSPSAAEVPAPMPAPDMRTLLTHQRVASLATLHAGAPAVSMVPFALLPQGRGLVIHVSSLATHTADLQAHPVVSLMVTAVPEPDASVLALPRVTLLGDAAALPAASADHAEARSIYLERFPEAEPLFNFSDFSLFVIAVRSARFIGGFAQAKTITGEGYRREMDDDFRGGVGGEVRGDAGDDVRGDMRSDVSGDVSRDVGGS